MEVQQQHRVLRTGPFPGMENLRRFRRDGFYLDAKLSPHGSADVVIRAHRNVLASCSPFLQKQFGQQSDPEATISLFVPELSLRQAVDLIYEGQIALDSEVEFDNLCSTLRSLQISLGPEVDAVVYQGCLVMNEAVPIARSPSEAPQPLRIRPQTQPQIRPHMQTPPQPQLQAQPQMPSLPRLPAFGSAPEPMGRRVVPIMKAEESLLGRGNVGKAPPPIKDSSNNLRFDPLRRASQPAVPAPPTDGKQIVAFNSRQQHSEPVAPPVAPPAPTRPPLRPNIQQGTEGLYWVEFRNDNGQTYGTVDKQCADMRVSPRKVEGLEDPNGMVYLAFNARADVHTVFEFSKAFAGREGSFTELKSVSGPANAEVSLPCWMILKFANPHVITPQFMIGSLRRNKMMGFGQPEVNRFGHIEVPFDNMDCATAAKKRYIGQNLMRNRILDIEVTQNPAPWGFN